MPESGKLTAGIAGAAGYVGGELIRILAGHGQIGRIVAFSDSWQGRPVSAAHPRLLAIGRELDFVPFSPQQLPECDVVFFATPVGVAAKHAPALLAEEKIVVDCGPDFRLRDIGVWQQVYSLEHPAPELVEQAAYGLPELFAADTAKANLIAAPGCYATCIQLAAAPVVRVIAGQGATEVRIVAAGMSGTSGAGRRTDRPDLLLAEAGNNACAYALDGHRHAPEIVQGIGKYAGLEAQLAFVPHLLPLPRGMLATIHIIADGKFVPAATAADALARTYENEPCVSVLPAGSSPQLASVLHTDRAVLGTSGTGKSAAIVCALDNLGKGAAGQAVQCLNLRLGLAAATGLTA